MSEYFIDEYGIEQEDIFHEQQTIKEFDSLVRNTHFHVYGLTADWGTGKTSFIKMWQQFSLNQHHEDSSVIYVDAFSKDYIEDPFMMLISVFKQFMKDNNVSKEIGNRFLECAKKIGFSAIKASAIVASQLIPNDLIKVFANGLIGEFTYNPRGTFKTQN